MRYRYVTCHVCGGEIIKSWYWRHIMSGCRQGFREGTTDRLSHRQWQVVRRLAMDGTTYRVIAQELGVSYQTVKNHAFKARKRLGCVGEDRTTLLMTALRRGEVTMDELIAPAHVLGRRRDDDA